MNSRLTSSALLAQSVLADRFRGLLVLVLAVLGLVLAVLGLAAFVLVIFGLAAAATRTFDFGFGFGLDFAGAITLGLTKATYCLSYPPLGMVTFYKALFLSSWVCQAS